MDVAWVSSFVGDTIQIRYLDGDADAFGLSVGLTGSIADSYCQRVIDGVLPSLIPDTSKHEVTASLAATDAMPIGAYIGVPLEGRDGTVSGMLCAISSAPVSHLGKRDVTALSTLGGLIAEVVNGGHDSRAKHRETFDRVRETIDGQRFAPVFQPIVDARTGTTVGAEALSRFVDPPTRPDLWFADAAEVGLGVDLEIAAIDAALDHLGDLPEECYLSVNASPSTIVDRRLVESLTAADTSRVQLEITEHAEIRDYRSLSDALEPLRELGVKVVVDDVGAGFSNFAHVLELDPDVLKIDISIARGVHRDTARRALVESIVDLSLRIGAAVVAEGIEDQEDLDALAGLGVGFVQGYYLARPGPLPLPEVTTSARHVERVPTTPAGFATTAPVQREFELALLHSPIGVTVVGLDGTFLHVNPALASMLGYSVRSLNQLTFQELTHPDDLDADMHLLNECLAGRRTHYRIDKRYIRRDGSIVWGDLSVVLVRSHVGEPLYFISQIQDISAEKTREAELAAMAETDVLTGLSNRNAVISRLESMAAAETPVGVLLCDLDGFHQVNERHGHAAGDHVLIAVAARIRHATRGGDVVARWGGDQFLVVTEASSPRALEHLARRVVGAVSLPLTTHDPDVTMVPGVTVGVAHHDGFRHVDVDELVGEADRSMAEQRSVRQ